MVVIDHPEGSERDCDVRINPPEVLWSQERLSWVIQAHQFHIWGHQLDSLFIDLIDALQQLNHARNYDIPPEANVSKGLITTHLNERDASTRTNQIRWLHRIDWLHEQYLLEIGHTVNRPRQTSKFIQFFNILSSSFLEDFRDGLNLSGERRLLFNHFPLDSQFSLLERFQF